MDDTIKINGSKIRQPEYKIDQRFLDRWSPRAFSPVLFSDADLFPLFEAAKWAPSSFNAQPWRFLYARRDTENWPLFFDLLVKDNQSWAKNAAVLVVIISRTTFERDNEPSRTHTFDSGAAWSYLALQGAMRGLAVHGMEGFDYDKARRDLNVPPGYDVHAMAAIGKPGHKSELPLELQAREKPNDRKKLAEVICEGKFRFDGKPGSGE